MAYRRKSTRRRVVRRRKSTGFKRKSVRRAKRKSFRKYAKSLPYIAPYVPSDDPRGLHPMKHFGRRVQAVYRPERTEWARMSKQQKEKTWRDDVVRRIDMLGGSFLDRMNDKASDWTANMVGSFAAGAIPLTAATAAGYGATATTRGKEAMDAMLHGFKAAGGSIVTAGQNVHAIAKAVGGLTTMGW